MAVQATATTQYLLRTVDVGGLGGANFSMCGWAKIDTANSYDILFGASNAANGRLVTIGTTGANLLAIVDNVSETAFAQQPDVGRWFFVGLISHASGGNVLGFWKYPGGQFNLHSHTNATEGSVQLDRLGIFIGRVADVGDNFKGHLAGIKLWNNVRLTMPEMTRESMQIAPVRWPNLYGFWPLDSVATQFQDESGFNHPLTATGTLTTTGGPPVPYELVRDDWWIEDAASGGGSAFPHHYYAQQHAAMWGG